MAMTAQELLAGARAWTKRRDITYQMGGEDLRQGGKLDCSAFVWQVLGESKHDRNTDWIVTDCLGKHTKFKPVDMPFPGCIAVYPSRWERVVGKPPIRHAGHVGIVTDPVKKLVVDCSSSQNGIREHRQSVLFTGPSDGRKPIFCVPC